MRIWKVVKKLVYGNDGKQYRIIRIWDERRNEWVRDRYDTRNIHQVVE